MQSSILGKTNEAGCPNITGSFSVENNLDTNDSVTGAFYNGGSGNSSGANGGDWACAKVQFNASRSSILFGKSDTVMPASINLPSIIYLGK